VPVVGQLGVLALALLVEAAMLALAVLGVDAPVLRVRGAAMLGGLVIAVLGVEVGVLACASSRCWAYSASPRSSRPQWSRARLRTLGPSTVTAHRWIASCHVAWARVASNAPVRAALDQTPGEVFTQRKDPPSTVCAYEEPGGVRVEAGVRARRREARRGRRRGARERVLALAALAVEVARVSTSRARVSSNPGARRSQHPRDPRAGGAFTNAPRPGGRLRGAWRRRASRAPRSGPVPEHKHRGLDGEYGDSGRGQFHGEDAR
jgi:hypothetical protein